MRRLPAILALASVATAVAVASAKPITSADEVRGAAITIDFRELKDKDKLAFGSPEIGQPYSRLGLVLPSQIIDTTAKLNPDLAIAVKSSGVSTINNANFQSLAFTTPQRQVGFNLRSEKATQVVVTAMDKTGKVLGEQILPASAETRFVGFAFEDASITVIRIVAPHATMGDALNSPTYVSGIIFSANEGEQDGGQLALDGGSLDTGLAGAVGSPGGNSGNAFASAAGSGFGASGSGSAGNLGGGRNPGNRNPNLPPAIIPEPATLGTLTALAALLTLRPRRT